MRVAKNARKKSLNSGTEAAFGLVTSQTGALATESVFVYIVFLVSLLRGLCTRCVIGWSRPYVHVPACFNSRTTGRVRTTFGTGVLPHGLPPDCSVGIADEKICEVHLVAKVTM